MQIIITFKAAVRYEVRERRVTLSDKNDQDKYLGCPELKAKILFICT